MTRTEIIRFIADTSQSATLERGIWEIASQLAALNERNTRMDEHNMELDAADSQSREEATRNLHGMIQELSVRLDRLTQPLPQPLPIPPGREQ